MTAGEKIAGSVSLILIARVAAVATPLIITAIIWLGLQWFDLRFARITDSVNEMKSRIVALESVNEAQTMELADAKAKIEFSGQQREEMRASVQDQFLSVNSTLKEISARLSDVNGSVIKLGTIINERVPKKDDHADIQ